MPVTEEIDAIVRTATDAGERKRKAGEGGGAKVFVVRAYVDRFRGREGRSASIGEE